MSDQDAQIGPDDAIVCSSAVGPQSPDDESCGSTAEHAKFDQAMTAWCKMFDTLDKLDLLADAGLDVAVARVYDCIDKLRVAASHPDGD